MSDPTTADLADLFSEAEAALIREGGRSGISRDEAIDRLDDYATEAGYEVGRAALRRAVDLVRGNPEASKPRDERAAGAGAPTLEAFALGEHPSERRSYSEKGGVATVTVVTAKVVKTLDDLLDACEMDGRIWEVLDWEASAWNSPVKKDTVVSDPVHPDSGKTYKISEPQIVQLHRVKARFRKNKVASDFSSMLGALVDEFAERLVPIRVPTPPRATPRREFLAVPHMPDAHIGVVDCDDEYTVEAAVARILDATHHFLRCIDTDAVERFCLPWGHDLSQINRVQSTSAGTQGFTGSGTPIAYRGTFHQIALAAEVATAEVIRALLEVAPVDVVVVPGNHGPEVDYWLGRVMGATFAHTDHVRIDNGESMHKFYEYGRNGFLLSHGKEVAWNDLLPLFSMEAPELWGRTIWREALTGHLHHKKGRHVGDYLEGKGGVARLSPALCNNDWFHHKKGYSSLPGAECFVYHRDGGLAQHTPYHVLPSVPPRPAHLAA